MPAKPTATEIVFVRHGQTPTTGKILPGRAKGLNLSDEGRLQAIQVAKELANSQIDAIYCSPLERARQTAKPIGKAIGLTPIVHKGFIEADFGDWTGMELRKLNKLKEWSGVVNNPEHFRFPNGESFLEMQARLRDAIENVTDNHSGQRVVVVSHADPIKMILCLALNASIRSMHHIDIATTSRTTIRYGSHGQATVVRVNEICQTGDQG